MTNRSDLVDVRRLYTKVGHRQIRRAEVEAIQRVRDHTFLENPYLFDRTVVVALARSDATAPA